MIKKNLDELLGEERFEALEMVVKRGLYGSRDEFEILYEAFVESIKDYPDEVIASVIQIGELVKGHYLKYGDKNENKYS